MSSVIWIQAVTLVGVVLLFDTWERLQPGHPLERRPGLALDLAAIALVIVFGEVGKFLIVGGLEHFHLTPAAGHIAPLAALPLVPKILLAIATADLCLYWMHRAMHDSDLLWNTHRFHHSITQLYWLSGSRTSVLHLFLFALTQMTVCYALFGLSVPEASFAFSFGVAVNIWVHANIHVDLGPLQWLLITPDYHRIHHAADERSRKNLGFVFTLWDRMFGTYVDPRSVTEPYELGSAEPDKGYPRQMLGV
jgi:sterol desaturase/sphingolipid hydroxylase (fatty acid hydroxylase superfamily)